MLNKSKFDKDVRIVAESLTSYLRKNWVIYGLLGVYGLSLVFNALGLQTWLPSCLVSNLTGYNCIGCGLNTAAIQLLQGNVLNALRINPLLFAYLPIVAFMIGYDFYKFTRNLKKTNYE